MRWWHKLRQKIPRRQKPLRDKTRVWCEYFMMREFDKYEHMLYDSFFTPSPVFEKLKKIGE